MWGCHRWWNWSLVWWKWDLRLAASLCPFVTSVHIDCTVGINDYDVLGLIGLKHFNRLTILASRSARESSITFDGGLVPFLKVAGSSMKYLALHDFRFLHQSVRFTSLVEYCPNLEDLSLVCCKYSLSPGLEEGEVSYEVIAGRAHVRMKPDLACTVKTDPKNLDLRSPKIWDLR